MLFEQLITYQEYMHGNATVIFRVSDIYGELFLVAPQVSPLKTDIFMSDSIKEDLNTDDGKFAVNEMTFSCRHTACKNEIDEQAMFFCLDAANKSINRFVAVFFDSVSLDNLVFSGKIDSKISGSDIVWENDNWGININPKRDYKFSVLSFDISIIDQVKLTDKLFDSDGNSIKNLYDWIEDEINNEEFTIKQFFGYRLAYSRDTVSGNMIYQTPLGNLYKILSEFLRHAKKVIAQLSQVTVQFNLLDVSLGIHTCPVSYQLKSENSAELQAIVAEQNKRIEIRLSPDDGDETWSPPYIHRKMVDPAYGNDASTDDKKLQISKEKELSFKSFDNLSELLFAIARSFGCYLYFHYNANYSFDIEFKSRKSLVEENYTYFVNATDASIDSNAIQTKEANQYYAQSSLYSLDGYDEVANEPNTDKAIESELLKRSERIRKQDKERNSLESERLVLSTGAPKAVLCAVNTYGGHLYYVVPLNVTTNITNWNTDRLMTIANTPGEGNSSSIEHLATNIFIRTKPTETSQIARLGANTDVWKPATKIFSKINNKDLDFETLSDYVNYIQGRDENYYETEYSITVPYWNGFSKNTDGSNASWQNIKLGSKIRLSEVVKRYNGENAFSNVTVFRDYVVVGKEINLQKPETKLKLHSLERFAFGFWDGDEGQLPGYVTNVVTPTTIIDDNIIVERGTVATGETILKGDAVMIMSDGKIRKSESKSIYKGKTRAIALDNGIGGDSIRIQISGTVTLDWFNWDMNKPIWCRTKSSGTNLTQNPLLDKTAEEDLYIVIGYPLTQTKFLINIDEYVFV